jgi:type IV secretion system protein VirB4
LLYGKTEGSAAFRFSLHVGDVDHPLIVGLTGAGKNSLLALLAMPVRRYENSQVFSFDFGGSIRAAAICMGGDRQDLAQCSPTERVSNLDRYMAWRLP